MATIGQPLTAPEEGWKRYDDTYPAFRYIGSGWSYYAYSGGYNGGTNRNSNAGSITEFSFIGTKLRIISAKSSDSATDIRVEIDGVETAQINNTYGQPALLQVLAYEVTGLENKKHTVRFKNISGGVAYLDAVDIDLNGRLLHSDEVLSPKDLAIGKRIRCHYTALTSGQFGGFSKLGEETFVDGKNDFIPSSSSTTPNGDFYYICVDKDHLGRWKLIADRNVQHSISWDTLNSVGIASGSGFPIIFENQDIQFFSFSTRLLTGGISSTDKDNEWDKYIVNSTLNGTITAGDSKEWNLIGLASWTSTVPISSSVKRAVRGRNTTDSSASAYGEVETNFVSTSVGGMSFRPVLLIDALYTSKSFILFNGEYKIWNGSWQSISATLPTKDTFINEGMSDLSSLDRKSTFFTQDMMQETLGSGKVFKSSIDLKKLFSINNIKIN